MSRNILITGGAGFIGSRLVTALLEAEPDCKIWVYDNLHPQVHGTKAEAPSFPDSVVFIKGDITDKASLQLAISKSQPEVVYHLAAETGTGQSYDEISRYCEVNVIGTTNLIECIRMETGDVTKNVVLSASRAVYGEGAYRDDTGRVYVGLPREMDKMAMGDFDVSLPGCARFPFEPAASKAGLEPAPASIYASSKLMQEYIVKQAGEGATWRATILRFQNVYGPGQSLKNPYTGVLSIFSRQLLEGKSLEIYEDGLIARDFVYVDDVVNSLVRAADVDLPHGSTIDIGSGEAITILEVARILMRSLGISDENYFISGKYRVGDIRYACADIEEAHNLLKWEPKVTAQKGLSLLADWAKNEFQLNKL